MPLRNLAPDVDVRAGEIQRVVAFGRRRVDGGKGRFRLMVYIFVREGETRRVLDLGRRRVRTCWAQIMRAWKAIATFDDPAQLRRTYLVLIVWGHSRNDAPGLAWTLARPSLQGSMMVKSCGHLPRRGQRPKTQTAFPRYRRREKCPEKRESTCFGSPWSSLTRDGKHNTATKNEREWKERDKDRLGF